MIVHMSETTPPSEPATGPLATAGPAPTIEPRRNSRVTLAAAWVGIVAGVVFIVAVIFFSGFILGAHSGGGHHGWHHGGGHGDAAIFHRGGPPPMMGPRGEMPPWAPGGPSFQGPSQTPGAPSTPGTTAPSRP
jgi:hypothetical protein